MKKDIHVVFPLHFKQLLVESFGQSKNYNLKGYDTDISHYQYFILDEDTKEYADTVLISTYDHGELPFKQIVSETVDIAVKIKIARPDIRLVFVFPELVAESYEFRDAINKLIMASIYDLHFYTKYDFHHIESWLDNVQTLVHVKDFITKDDIPQLMAQAQNKEEIAVVFNDHSLLEEKKESPAPVIEIKEERVPEIKEESSIPSDRDKLPYTPTPESEPIAEEKSGGKLKGFFHLPRKKEENVKATEPIPAEPKVKEEKPVPLTEQKIEKMIVKQSRTTKRIAVIGLTRSVGTSFIAVNFASFLTKCGVETGVYENPITDTQRTYLADMFFMFNEDKPNQSLPHCIVKGEEFNRKQAYKVKDTHYYPVDYTTAPILDFTTSELFRYINTGTHQVKIADMGYITDKDLMNKEVITKLSGFDDVLLVVDPLPLKLMPFTQNCIQLQHDLEMQGVNFKVILNQYNGEIPKSDLKVFELHKGLEIPSVERTEVIKSMYKKQAVYDYSTKTQQILNEPFMKLANTLDLPIEIELEKNKKFNLLKRAK